MAGRAQLRAGPSLDETDLVAILDSLPHLLTMWDDQRRCVFANAAGAAALGRPPTAMLRAPMEGLFGQHGVRLLERHIDAALAGHATEHERALFGSQGDLRLYQSSYTPVLVRGAVIGFAILLVDITDQLRTQAEVARDSEVVARLRTRHGLMSKVGAEVLGQLGNVLDELVILTEPPSLPGDVLDEIRRTVTDCIQRLRMGGDVVASAPPIRTQATPPVAPDDETGGAPLPETGQAPVSVGRIGGPLEAVHGLVDQLPLMITEWSPDLRLRFANRAATAYIDQWTEQDVVGRHLSEIVDDEFLHAHQGFVDAVMHGRAQSFHREQPAPDGQVLHYHARYIPRVRDGEVVGAYAYGTDITLRIEAAKQLSEARAAYTALRERQAVEEVLHGVILQELFAATLCLESAGRQRNDFATSHLARAREYTEAAIRSLESLRDPG